MTRVEGYGNGKDFNPQGEFQGHLCLRPMREWVKLFAGSLRIGNVAAAGMVIRAQLPQNRRYHAPE